VGGIGLVIIAIIAIIYTQFMGVAPAPETSPAPAEAPVMLYWVSPGDRRRRHDRRVCSGATEVAHLRRHPTQGGRTSSSTEPIRIAPLRLDLDDEGLAADGELVAGAGVTGTGSPPAGA
jgi:hypothetical protein